MILQMRKLAIVTSHPIQYNAPMFRLLAERGKIAVKVFYSWGQAAEGPVYDPDFRRSFQWDVPLLDGYAYAFIANVSSTPGAGHFFGIRNKELIPALEEWGPDSLLVYGWSFESHLQVLRHFHGKCQILFRGDSTVLDEPAGFSLRKLFRRLFLRWVYQFVDVALYTGACNKEYYLKHGVPISKLVYAPHAVDNVHFSRSDKPFDVEATLWRKELGIPTESLVFLFAGKLEPKKDPLLLVQAFMLIDDPTIRLVIAGNGILEEAVRSAAAKDTRIHVLGFQNQQKMPVLYRMGDVFVLPSKGPGETWGLSINEAMACGRAVIVSSKCGCSPDLVTNNGYVFAAGNLDELQDCLKRFIAFPEKTKEMGALSLMKIEAFTHLQQAVAIEKIICN